MLRTALLSVGKFLRDGRGPVVAMNEVDPNCCREVVEQVAALLAPAAGRAMLGRAGDAPAHRVDLALVALQKGSRL